MQPPILGTVPTRPGTNNDGFPNQRGVQDISLFRQRKCGATRPSGMLRAVISDTGTERVFVRFRRCRYRFRSDYFCSLSDASHLSFPPTATISLFLFFDSFLPRPCSGAAPIAFLSIGFLNFVALKIRPWFTCICLQAGREHSALGLCVRLSISLH